MSFFGWSSYDCSWIGCTYSDYYDVLDDAARDYYASYKDAYLSGNLYAWEAAYRDTFIYRYNETLREMSRTNPGFTFSINLW